MCFRDASGIIILEGFLISGFCDLDTWDGGFHFLSFILLLFLLIECLNYVLFGYFEVIILILS